MANHWLADRELAHLEELAYLEELAHLESWFILSHISLRLNDMSGFRIQYIFIKTVSNFNLTNSQLGLGIVQRKIEFLF